MLHNTETIYIKKALTSKKRFDIIIKLKKYFFGVWHSLVVRLVRDQEVVGSNPVTPTKKEPTFVYDKCGFFSTKSVLSDGINPAFVG